MQLKVMKALYRAHAERRSVVLVTNLANGTQKLLDAEGIDVGLVDDADLRSVVTRRVKTLGSGVENLANGRYYIHVVQAQVRIVVIGAVHIAQVLAPMLLLAGYQVVVVDPRTSFCTPQRFPGVELSTQWPDEYLQRHPIDHSTAIVTLTHDAKLDDPALAQAIVSDAFYIGALGSKRTHARRCARLAEGGAAKAELDRINGPIGLDLGGRSAADIAIAAVAQINQYVHRGVS